MGIVIFSGTTEGREISDYLSSRQIMHIVCVATASGEAVMSPSDFADIRVGRLDEEGLRAFLSGEKAICDKTCGINVDDSKSKSAKDCIVIDATHPYAEIITNNLKKVCGDLQIKYIRVSRASEAICLTDSFGSAEFRENNVVDFISYTSAAECAKHLINEDGNILLTTGSKELACYTQYDELRDRLFVRVLPTVEAINLCQKAGINEKHIIAMYGPHTKETNVAVLKQFNIQHMVTKESGKTGGFEEKMSAAKDAGSQLYVIERPLDEGISVDECIDMLSHLKAVSSAIEIENVDSFFGENIITNNIHADNKLEVKLVGIGPGSREMMTVQAVSALENADIVFGAKRMLECYEKIVADNTAARDRNIVKFTEYVPEKIIEKLDEILSLDGKTNKTVSKKSGVSSLKNELSVVALFSGDTAHFSGASKLYKSLMEWGRCDSVQIVPGISSFSAFAACIGTDLTYAHMESLHGKSTDMANWQRISSLIKQGEKVFLLMSGKSDFEVLSDLLPAGYTGEILVGQNISYPEQVILHTSAQTLMSDIGSMTDGLFICYVSNDNNYDVKGTKEPTLMISAVSSGSGKTMITCGILAELKRLGKNVKAYKCGPDYIDPMFHSEIIGVKSENLDSFFVDADYINNILRRNDWADISVIEGAMGLYDGILGKDRIGSAYDVAVKTGTPIVLIVDAHGMGNTLVSVIKGILLDDDKNLIKGVIINRISVHYYESIRTTIENETGVKVLGFVPKLKDINIDSRHLGLKMPNEIEQLENQLEIVRSEIEKTVDVDGLIEIAGVQSRRAIPIKIDRRDKRTVHDGCVMAVAYDEVFCFYYEENFRLLKEAGVEIKFFSPLHDEKLPEGVAGILLGGGYPELKLAELSANVSMRNSIKEAYESGMPVLAECGGFMYLHDAIEADGQSYDMVGAVSGKCFNTGKLCRFGYVDLNIAGYDIKGHEFHYYDSTNNGDDGTAKKPGNGKQWSFGHYDEGSGSLMGYPHLYYGSCQKFVTDFVEHMRKYQKYSIILLKESEKWKQKFIQ